MTEHKAEDEKREFSLFRALLKLLLLLLALALIALAVVSFLRIPIDLSAYRPTIESAASKALGRGVKVDGDITVTTSLWPYFEIRGLRIANPPGFAEGDLATMEMARVTLGLLPLLEKRVRIRQFRVDGISLDLVTNDQGDGNWVLQGQEQEAQQTPETDAPGDTEKELDPEAVSVDELLLENISVDFHGAAAEPLQFTLERAEGAAALGEPMRLDMHGKFLKEAFTLELNASSLAGFLAMTQAELGIQLDIAETRFSFAGRSEALRDSRTTRLKLTTKGDDLSSLNDLLNLDLPPLKDYELTADLLATPKKLELSTLEARVKNSELAGHVEIDRTSAHPLATIELTSDRIQRQDFDTGDWTAEDTPADQSQSAGAQAPTDDQPRDQARRAKLLSSTALQKADIKLSIKVKEVLSGEDRLGSGDLTATLQDGRIALNPLRLELPKASLLVKASLKPGRKASEASLRVLIENFDFGVLSRLSDPNSKVGGTLNLDLDVNSYASNSNIMAGANGYFDISAQPTNLQSGIVDLWAVNLLSSVVTSASKDEDASEVNCLIGRFRLEQGVMSAEQLAADTSRIRICGEGNVSFANETFKLVAVPKAKRAEFFSLATPLAVRGEFDDFRIGMKAGVLTLGTTAVNFVISPITTPFKRLFRADLPQDGADICLLPIGPRERKLESLPGC